MTGVGSVVLLAKVEAGNRNATIDFMEKAALELKCVTLGQLFEAQKGFFSMDASASSTST